jgi:hypothetical protein
LEQACLALHGQDKPVNVKIRPEPLNPMDPSTIAGSPYYVFWIQLPWYFAGIFFIIQYTSEKHAGSCIQNTQ